MLETIKLGTTSVLKFLLLAQTYKDIIQSRLKLDSIHKLV